MWCEDYSRMPVVQFVYSGQIRTPIRIRPLRSHELQAQRPHPVKYGPCPCGYLQPVVVLSIVDGIQVAGHQHPVRRRIRVTDERGEVGDDSVSGAVGEYFEGAPHPPGGGVLSTRMRVQPAGVSREYEERRVGLLAAGEWRDARGRERATVAHGNRVPRDAPNFGSHGREHVDLDSVRQLHHQRPNVLPLPVPGLALTEDVRQTLGGALSHLLQQGDVSIHPAEFGTSTWTPVDVPTNDLDHA